MDSDATILQDDISNDLVFANFPDSFSCVRNPNVDPMSRFLAAWGGSVVDKTDFLMVGEDGALETPLATTSDEVWELPECRIATARPREWHVGARLAAQVRGDATN